MLPEAAHNQDMITLTTVDRGTFLMTTRSGSAYTLTLTGTVATMRRIPADKPAGGFDEVSQLRSDTQTVTIQTFRDLHVGQPGFFSLDPLGGNGAVTTFRRTSLITRIERITDAL